MRKAGIQDRQRVIDLIVKCYEANASVVWILKRDRFFKRRLQVLARYCFLKGLSNQGVFFSTHEKGLCILYRLESEKTGWRAGMAEMALVFCGIGLFRLPRILMRDRYIRKHRQSGRALYAWIFAVDPESRTGREAREIRDFIFKKSDQENIPVLAETSMPQNKKVYERFGFETYHQWEDPKTGMITWFLRRNPEISNQK